MNGSQDLHLQQDIPVSAPASTTASAPASGPTSAAASVSPASGVEDEVLGIGRSANGFLIPREQDVFWSLEIIAFVSKYSYLRREIQETHLLPQLSLRPDSELYEEPSDNKEMQPEMDSMQCGLHAGMQNDMQNNTQSEMQREMQNEMRDDMHDDNDTHHECKHTHCAKECCCGAPGDEMNDDMFISEYDTDKVPEDLPDLPDDVEMDLEETGSSVASRASSLVTASRDSFGQDLVDSVRIVDPAFPSAAFGDILSYNLSLAQMVPLEMVESNPKLLRYYQHDFETPEDYSLEHHARKVKLFELVERFTKFRNPREFPYWACIIMRNFVRKDEEGIRQCANFACGKWETYPRQFAKCRRCKRTKYCSKACQLTAWSMHRYWCAPSPSSHTQSQESEGH